MVISPPEGGPDEPIKKAQHSFTNQRIGLNPKENMGAAPIIEEVTKENFFTKDQARSSRFSLNKASRNGSFDNRRSVSQVQNASSLHMTYKEKQDKSHALVPHDCKVLCFCQSRTMLANLVKPEKASD